MQIGGLSKRSVSAAQQKLFFSHRIVLLQDRTFLMYFDLKKSLESCGLSPDCSPILFVKPTIPHYSHGIKYPHEAFKRQKET